MKRGDIQPWQVYGYQTQREHIYRYSPVMVLAKGSYFRARFGERQVEPCQDHTERLAHGSSYRSPVGLLAVMLNANHTDHDSVRKLRALATVDDAITALNEDGAGVRDIHDTADTSVVLGTYFLMTDARHLHGGYHELVAALEASQQRSRDIAQEREEVRLAAVATHNELADRLDAMGITGYHVAAYESPTRFEKLTFEDMERLVHRAENAFTGEV